MSSSTQHAGHTTGACMQLGTSLACTVAEALLELLPAHLRSAAWTSFHGGGKRMYATRPRDMRLSWTDQALEGYEPRGTKASPLL